MSQWIFKWLEMQILKQIFKTEGFYSVEGALHDNRVARPLIWDI